MQSLLFHLDEADVAPAALYRPPIQLPPNDQPACMVLQKGRIVCSARMTRREVRWARDNPEWAAYVGVAFTTVFRMDMPAAEMAPAGWEEERV